MAEERLIDDNTDKDKDKKYRFRINEDGEEELEIYGGDEEEEEAGPEDELVDSGYEVPEFDDDDEEAAAMTPEQLFAERKKQEEERTAREMKAAELINKALLLRDGGNEEYALTSLDSAQKECPDNGGIYVLKLGILTKDFTDISRLDECIDAAAGCKTYASAEDKSRISAALSEKIKSELEAQRAQNAQLKADNEQKKSDRRAVFMSGFKVALRNFLFAFIPFVAFLCAAVALTPQMYSDKNGTMLALTIAMYALAGAAFIASVILARFVATSARRLKVNESNLSTALGRTYTEGTLRAEKLEKLYSLVH